MSELIETRNNATILRARLLATACAIALIAMDASVEAQARDSAAPTVWIELGGQLERMSNGQDVFAPPFLESFAENGFDAVTGLQRPPRYGFGGELSALFRPGSEGWQFSASVRYSRSNSQIASSQQQAPIPYYFIAIDGPRSGYFHPAPHLNATAKSSDSNLIADFQAGKDVGLGFLPGASSSMSLGVRFAQFTSKRDMGLNGVPSLFHTGTSVKYGYHQSHARYLASLSEQRSFRGIGPSIDWRASEKLAGNGDDSSFTFDWGINAAVLFGRQKVRGETNVTGSHYKTGGMIALPIITFYEGIDASYHSPRPIERSRSVVVPNIGGFAGVSLKFPNAKVSLGYRADFFFGAMDGGIETHKSYDRNFYGPFATISIGLGG